MTEYDTSTDMTDNSQHVQEHVEKKEKKDTRKRKDTKPKIDMQSGLGSTPPPETEIGNTVNGSVAATDVVGDEAMGVYKYKDNAETDVNNQRSETEADVIKRKRDEEISACFEAAKQKLGGLLKKKKQVIRDLAYGLERLGRPVDHIAAEIVHELRNCEELSRSQIYSYLDDKYKNQTQAQRRKGRSNANPDPKTGTESPQERAITVGSNGQQITSNKHDIPELKEQVDTPAESVTSNQQSNPANLQKSDWNPDPKTGPESTPDQGRTEQSTNTNTNASEPGSMTAQSIDMHMTGEDSMYPGPSDKSPVCENCSIKGDRIKKLEDENRELGVRCSWAESSNSELDLQLKAQENYINKLLEEKEDLSHSPEQYVGQECPRCRGLEEQDTE